MKINCSIDFEGYRFPSLLIGVFYLLNQRVYWALIRVLAFSEEGSLHDILTYFFHKYLL